MKKKENLEVVYVNILIFKFRAAPYLRDIVISLFRNLAAVVTLNLQLIIY